MSADSTYDEINETMRARLSPGSLLLIKDFSYGYYRTYLFFILSCNKKYEWNFPCVGMLKSDDLPSRLATITLNINNCTFIADCDDFNFRAEKKC